MVHAATETAPAPKRWYRLSLTQQIVLGLIIGCVLGWWISRLGAEAQKSWSTWLEVPRDIFLHLIKAMIAPLIFASVVQGIACTGDMKKVGRIGANALIYGALDAILGI